MIANYHTHTARCGHARGEDREYVERAVERGLETLGFSEHVPLPFADGHESYFRVPLARLEDYVRSVLALREEFRDFDAKKRFQLKRAETAPVTGCRCGDVITGKIRPEQCPLFGKACTPEDPVGPCMVSSEGACAAQYKYQS